LLAAKLAFWMALALAAHTYVLYPALLFVAYALSQLRRDLRYLSDRQDRRRPALGDDQLPRVSLIVAAYNEQQTLPGKIANLYQLDYPRQKLQIVIVSDGSTDGTNQILGQLGEPEFHTVILPERKGKANAINEAVAHSRHEVLVLSDASTLFVGDAVRKLVRHFADPQVGVVCGELRFVGSAEHRQTEGLYWRYESALRLMEARLGATLTASGAIYAVRREAFQRLAPDVIVEDLVMPMNARRCGFRVLYDPEAVASEIAAQSVADEYTRRVRIAVGSFKELVGFLRVPLGPLTFLAFLSHKLLRWVLPFLLIGLLGSNLLLLDEPIYRIALATQAVFYLWAALGFFLRGRLQEARYALVAYFLLAMHFAYLVGFARFLAGSADVRWQRVH